MILTPTRFARAIHLALLMLLLAGCGATQASGTAPASPTVGQAPAALVTRVDYRGISLTYDRALAAHVVPRYGPASEQMGTIVPEHIELDFDPDRTHMLPGRDTGIRVFWVGDLEQLDGVYRAGVAALEPMPRLPVYRTLRVNEAPPVLCERQGHTRHRRLHRAG